MKRIILIGFMGAGKTTLGKALAESLSIPFYDTDALIEQHTNSSISSIFLNYGESYFRTLEKETIEQLPKDSSYILAVGGGLPCFNDLMEILNSLGTTVYLKHDVTTLSKRLTDDSKQRPLVAEKSGDALISYIQEKVDERELVYLKAQLILEEAEQTSEGLIRRLNLLHQKS
jgi:shikimate kinase